jgi:hypothetical protein
LGDQRWEVLADRIAHSIFDSLLARGVQDGIELYTKLRGYFLQLS